MPFVPSGDVTLFVTEAGPSDAPAILFSNSLGTTHRMWDRVVDQLSVDYRCIRYDARGHGASTKSARAFEMADLAEDAVRILDNLQISKVHFAGLSLGGMAGQALALRHPHRLRSLTLMATTAYFPPAQSWRDRATLVRREGTRAILEATLSRWFTPAFLSSSPEMVERIGAEFAAINAEGYAACCEAIANMDFRPDLGDIAAPTLVLAGKQDPATSLDMLTALQTAIPHASLIAFDDAAHLLAVEQSEPTAQALAQHITRQEPEPVSAGRG